MKYLIIALAMGFLCAACIEENCELCRVQEVSVPAMAGYPKVDSFQVCGKENLELYNDQLDTIIFPTYTVYKQVQCR